MANTKMTRKEFLRLSVSFSAVALTVGCSGDDSGGEGGNDSTTGGSDTTAGPGGDDGSSGGNTMMATDDGMMTDDGPSTEDTGPMTGDDTTTGNPTTGDSGDTGDSSGDGTEGSSSGGFAGCGDDPMITISGNHGHDIVVPLADVEGGSMQTYNIQGASPHPHMITLSAADFTTLQTTGTVTVTSSTDNMHSHMVTLTCT